MPLRTTILAGLLGAIATLAWLALERADLSTDALELSSGTALATPQPLEAFSLQDVSGAAFTRENLKGRWSLVFVGFTHCPDACPVTLAVIHAAKARLDEAATSRLQTLFVSVDPERDTPSVLAEYVGYFDPDFIAATGSTSELARLCDSLGFGFVRVPQSAGRYTIDHSTAVALIDPQARVAGYFTQPLDVGALAGDLAGLPGAL